MDSRLWMKKYYCSEGQTWLKFDPNNTCKLGKKTPIFPVPPWFWIPDSESEPELTHQKQTTHPQDKSYVYDFFCSEKKKKNENHSEKNVNFPHWTKVWTKKAGCALISRGLVVIHPQQNPRFVLRCAGRLGNWQSWSVDLQPQATEGKQAHHEQEGDRVDSCQPTGKFSEPDKGPVKKLGSEGTSVRIEYITDSSVRCLLPIPKNPFANRNLDMRCPKPEAMAK